MEEIKKCSKCERELPRTSDYFEKRKESKDGLRGVCRECRGRNFLIKDDRYGKAGNIPDGYKKCKKCKEILLIKDNFKIRNSNIGDGYCNTCNQCRLKDKIIEGKKKCIRCERELELSECYFPIDKLCLDGFRNVCHECNGGVFGERRKYEEWTNYEIEILINKYPYYSNEYLKDKYFNNRSIESISDKATKCLGLKKDKRAMAERYWTEEQDRYVIENYPNTDTNVMAEFLNKNPKTVTARAIKLGVKKEEVWTKEEVEILKEVYSDHPNSVICEKFLIGKTQNSVFAKAQKLNLKKGELFYENYKKDISKNNLKNAQYKIINGQKFKVRGELHPSYVERIKVICPTCNKEFEVLESSTKGKNNVFCSRECVGKWRSENQRGENNPLFGRGEELWTEEMRKRKAEQQIKILLNTDFKSKKTKPQKITDNLLEELKLEYENEFDCKYYLIDNYIKEHNLMIEVQGNFFHCNPTMDIKNSRSKKIISKDKSKHTYVKNKYGIEILYLWEYDLINNIKMCKKLIEEYVSKEGNLNNYHSFNYCLDENNNLCEIENKYCIGY